MHRWFDADRDKWELIFAGGAFVLLSLLCFVRKMAIFAPTHMFANIIILTTVIAVIIDGTYKLVKNGNKTAEIRPVEGTFADALSFSVYVYEGIGVILPIQDICASPETYYKIVIAVIMSILGVYMIFG